MAKKSLSYHVIPEVLSDETLSRYAKGLALHTVTRTLTNMSHAHLELARWELENAGYCPPNYADED